MPARSFGDGGNKSKGRTMIKRFALTGKVWTNIIISFKYLSSTSFCLFNSFSSLNCVKLFFEQMLHDYLVNFKIGKMYLNNHTFVYIDTV